MLRESRFLESLDRTRLSRIAWPSAVQQVGSFLSKHPIIAIPSSLVAESFKGTIHRLWLFMLMMPGDYPRQENSSLKGLACCN